LAARLVERLGDRAVLVPMDGFHLANSELRRLGRSERKGAHDTFDGAGYVALLERLRRPVAGTVVYAPEFRRDLDESIAGAIAVPASTPLVVTEGNYLLLDREPWSGIRDLLDQAWFVALDPAVRLQRLVARHVHFGRDEHAARAWIAQSDEPNARLIEATRERADAVIALAERT
jgi:pantothenate kinase